MRLRFISTLIILSLGFALKGQSADNLRTIINKLKEIPDDWGNQSVVVLSQDFTYSYLRDNKNLVRKEIVNKQILLNDKNALNEFSTIYFRSVDEIQIQILKPNKEIIDVSIDNAILVEETVPMFFRTLYLDVNLSYYKLAIPGLQVGDILLYKYTSNDYTNDLTSIHTFAPFKFTLSSSYPILYQKITFEVDRGFYLAFNSYNNAPIVKQQAAGTDVKGRVRANIKVYSFEDKLRNKSEVILWHNKYLFDPLLKFQISYIPKNKFYTAPIFYKQDGTLKGKVNGNDIQELVDKKVKSFEIDKARLKRVYKYVDEENIKSLPIEEALEKVYNYFRFIYTGSNIASTFNSYYNANYSVNVLSSLSMYYFTQNFIEVLKYMDINYKVIAAMPSFGGRLDDLLFSEELVVLLKAYKGVNAYYLPTLEISSDFNYLPEGLEGAQAYEFSLFKNKKDFDSKKIILPENKEKSEMTHKIHVSLNKDLDNAKVLDTIFVDGLLKSRYTPIIVDKYDIMEDFRQNYGEYFRKIFGTDTSRFKYSEDQDEYIEAKNIMSKYFINDNFKVEDYRLKDIISTGLTANEQKLIYCEGYNVKNLIAKAGSNYMFNIGSLIGSQVNLSEDEKVRETDAHIEFQKKYIDIITVDYPKDFKLIGANKLDLELNNSIGEFSSKIITSGNGQLVIKVSKQYKKLQISKEEWLEMVQFLETAYDFSQLKLLLKNN